MKPGPESAKDGGLSFEAILAVPEGQAVDRDSLKPEERALVALTDGQRNVGDLLRLTGLSGFVVMRVLRSLRERGVLVEVGSSNPATTGEMASLSGTINTGSAKSKEAEAVPTARDKDKEKSGPSKPRAATQDLTEVIAQRIRLRTPMVPSPGKRNGEQAGRRPLDRRERAVSRAPRTGEAGVRDPGPGRRAAVPHGHRHPGRQHRQGQPARVGPQADAPAEPVGPTTPWSTPVRRCRSATWRRWAAPSRRSLPSGWATTTSSPASPRGGWGPSTCAGGRRKTASSGCSC